MDANIEHPTTLLFTISTVPSTGLNLQGCLEEELGEVAVECDLSLRAELGLDVSDARVKDGKWHLNAQKSLEYVQDLQLELDRYLEDHLEKDLDEVWVGNVLEHFERVCGLSRNFDKHQNEI